MKKILLFLVLLFSGLFTAVAQQNSISITLEDAIDMAMSRNEQVAINFHNEEIKRKEKKVAASLRSPSISLGASFVRMADNIDAFDFNHLKPTVAGILPSLGIQLPPSLVDKFMSTNWSYTLQQKEFGMVGINATMPIFMGGKINAANKAAKIKVEEQGVVSQQKLSELYSEVVERYYGLYLALQVVEVRKLVHDGMLLHLYNATQLEKNGVIAKVDRLYIQVKVSEATSELQKSIMTLNTLQSALSASLGGGGKFAPLSHMFVNPDIGTLDYYKTMCLENSPLIKQVQMKEQLAHQALRAERAEFYPHLVAMGGYDLYNYQLTSLAPKWVVGAGLKFTIFNGLNREFKVGVAKSTVKMVEAVKSKALVDIEVLVEKQYNEVVSSYQSVHSADATIEFATEYLRVKNLAFKEGSATAADVTDAILNLAKSKIERLTYAYKFDVGLAQMLENCGDSHRFAEIKSHPNTIIVELR